MWRERQPKNRVRHTTYMNELIVVLYGKLEGAHSGGQRSDAGFAGQGASWWGEGYGNSMRRPH